MTSTVQMNPNTSRPADAGEEAADTNIYVTPGAPTIQPPMPEFVPVMPKVETKVDVTQTAPAPVSPTPPVDEEIITTKTEKSINWGGVIKGVALVAAVVVVGVVAVHLGTALAASALATHAVSSIAATSVHLASPVIGAATSAFHWAVGFVPGIPGMVAGGFSHLVAGMGIGGATVANTAALSTTQAAAATHVAGTIAGGAALAVTVPPVAAALGHVNWFSDHLHTTTTLTHADPAMMPPAPGAHEGGLLSNFLSTKTMAANHAAHGDGSQITDTDAGIGHEALSHHSAHEEHHASEDGLPSIPGDIAGKPKRSWTNRSADSNSYSRSLAEHGGSHSAAIEASRKDRTPIGPRNASFSEELNNDRAKLDAAMGPAV